MPQTTLSTFRSGDYYTTNFFRDVKGHTLATMSRKRWKSGCESCGPGEASGWYCTLKIGLERCLSPSTV